MNYRHSFHAGNFADVLKHLVVLEILDYLLQKPKPICYVDTHAGRGLYDLSSVATGKTQEAALGIGLIRSQTEIPEHVAKYLAIIATINSDYGSQDKYYPGSPLMARHCLRADDRMVLGELHPDELAILKALFQGEPRAALHHLDAYQGLKAFLPPFERRGLVLIDPAFEVKDEFARIVAGLEQALQRFITGVYAIWYPIKDETAVKQFIGELRRLSGDRVLTVSLQPYADDYAFGLKACGMAVLNPPWQLAQKLTALMPWLWRALSPHGQGYYRIDN